MKQDVALRVPDVQVLISAAGSDVGVVCFYPAGDHPSDGWEVVTGISSKDALPVLRSILADALTALNDDRWVSVDELDSAGVSDEGDDFPF